MAEFSDKSPLILLLDAFVASRHVVKSNVNPRAPFYETQGLEVTLSLNV